MFKWRKPDIPADQVANFKPGPAAGPLFPAAPAASAAPIPSPAVPQSPAAGTSRIFSPPKESTTMNTSPRFPTPPAPNTQPQQSVRTSMRLDNNERRVLVIAKGITITGTISDAERVVVEGTLESVLVRAAEFSVSLGGVFKGEAEVDEAEVAGTVEGTVTARASLQVRAPGKIIGTARCRRLQVEDGGQIAGMVEMLTDAPAPEAAVAPAPTTTTTPAATHAEAWPSAMPVKPDLIG